ncbi:MAG: alpha,2-mannosyltransferase [Alphaproteobacteria bacterium]|jgi:hypothetical protein|nr:alpha,2-mannosyltransferase [Alphaproteobacteria bacterium]
MKLDLQGGRRASLAITGAMALFLLLNAFAVNGLLWMTAPANLKENVLHHTSDVFSAQGCDDSWGIMSFALEYARSEHTTPLYTEIFFNRNLKFQYPPSSLFTIAAMLRLGGPAHVRTVECQEYDMPTLNDMLGWVFILITIVSTAALLEIGLRRRFGPSPVLLIAARCIIVAGLALTFYPVVKAFTLGQIQVWINGVFALALLCWVMGWKASSGVLIGLMCLVKPHYGLFLLWAALRSEWRFVAALAATGVVGVGASLAVFGWTDNIDYLRVFWFLSQHGETFYPNQSVSGLLNRLMSLYDPVQYEVLDFNDNGFPPFNIWIYGCVLVTSLLLVASALFRRDSEGDPDRTFDFCTMALSITMASPIAWEHHYGIVFPMFAILLAHSIGNRARLVLLATSYVLISNYFAPLQLLAFTPWNVVQSYLFAAAIVLLMLLHTTRPGWRIAGVAARTPVPAGRPAH